LSKRVLVVEDNELNLKLFCDLLRAHEYTTEPVRDGREAVERARAFGPDLIVMDIQLPYVSGLELIETCKADAELRAIPIMAVTAYAGKEDEDRVRAAGAEAYVSKPISLMRFIGEVVALTPDKALPAVETDAADGPAQDVLPLDEPVEPAAAADGLAEDVLPEDEPDADIQPEDALPGDRPDVDAPAEDALPEDRQIGDEPDDGETAAIEAPGGKAEASTNDNAPSSESSASAADDEKPI
jgi:two-component system cell cycle response regulator DivK